MYYVYYTRKEELIELAVHSNCSRNDALSFTIVNEERLRKLCGEFLLLCSVLVSL